jgi:DNA-binding ferritin-like protein
MQAYKIAEDSGEIGVSNFLQDRVIAHQKHGWMLKATAK